jgi:hypothetical protein
MGKVFVAALVLFAMGSPLVASLVDRGFAYEAYVQVDSQGVPDPEDFDAQEQAPVEESRFSEQDECFLQQGDATAPLYLVSREVLIETMPDLSFPVQDIQRPPEPSFAGWLAKSDEGVSLS